MQNYCFAIDDIDGKTIVELVNEIDFSNKGVYEILIQSKDSSGNVSYKKIEVIVYDDFKINFFYYLFIIISLCLIIIIYIFRFKKSKKF